MGFKSVVFIAILATASSGPVNLNRPTSTTNQCAQQCTDKSKFQYTPGYIYEFTYEGQTRTGIQGASEDTAALKITTTAEVEVISKCDLVLRLRSSNVYGSNPDSPRNLQRLRNAEFSQALEQNPLRFSFQDGIVEELCPSYDESAWVLNIKRGVLSAFQNTMNAFATDQKLTETDVTGKCKTTYTVTQQGWRTITIKKSKDIMSCIDRHGYETAMQSALYRLPSSMQSLPLMRTSHECDQVVNTDGHVQSVLCHETHIFRPFSKENSGASTEVTQKLNFVSKRAAGVVSDLGSVTRREKLTFEHTGGEDMKTTDYQGAVDKLQELCTSTQEGIRPETPQMFSELVYLMKKLDALSLDSVYRQVTAASFCPNNAERTKRFYVDAIPMVGTGAAVRQITQLIQNNKITGVFAEMWLSSLAFIQHPTKEMISEISSLLTSENNNKVLLPISALINSYCSVNPDCVNDLEVDGVITKLEEFLGGNCAVTDATYTKVLLSLRAIGNIGHAQRLIPVLDGCIARKTNPTEIRVAAVEAYRRLSCGADRNNLMIVYRDSDEDAELRIAAYLQIMQCPNEYIISQVKETLTNEEVNQVGSFVWTHLTNLMESSVLYKQPISSIIQDERLQKEFDLDKRKFSRNYEWSYFSEKFNAGASLENNMIWSQKSFVPRSVMANLTIDMFGHSVNLLEVGGRVEGLEHLLEEYFGPTGIYTMEDGEDDSVPEKSTSRNVKMAKLNKIDEKFGAKVDDLKGALYVRMFGNEVKYARLGDKSESSQINMVEILMELAKQKDISRSMNSMFLDSSIIIPTMIGLPLNLTVNGTSAIDLKTTGRMDLQHGNRIVIEGALKPSGAVQISSIMSVDAFATKSGMKMSSTLHSSTAIQGSITFTNKQILKVEFSVPQERVEVFSLESSFFAIHGDQERRQNMIDDNRIDRSFCMGHTFARITGVDICGEIQLPNTTSVDDAPHFPFSGPLRMSINVLKRDTHTGYKFEASKIISRQKFVFSVHYDTPGSSVPRATGFDMSVNHKTKSMEMNMISPWKKASFVGNLVNKPVLKKVTGTLRVDDTKEYGVLSQMRRSETKNAITYTPNIEVRMPNRDAMTLTGSIQYLKKKSFVSSIKINNVLRDPIILDASIKNTPKEVGVSGSFSYQKDRQYSMEARVLRTTKNKKYTFNPILSVSTPTKDLIDLRGTIHIRTAKSVKFDLTLDRVFTVPLVLKGDGSVYVKGSRTKYKGKFNMKGPRCTMRTRFNIDKRANVISTLFQVDYNFARYFKWAKDGLRFDSKFVNKATKTLKNINLVTNFKSARYADYNNRVSAKLLHRKNRQTQFDTQLHFGKKYTRKENKKFIALQGKAQYRNTKVAANAAYNITFRYPFKNLDAAITGNHQHNKKFIRSSMKMVYDTKKNLDISIQLDNKSKQFPKYSGDISIKHEDRNIVLSGQYAENQNQRSAQLSVQHETDQVSTFEGVYKHKTDTEHEVTSNIQIYNKKPVTVRAGADFTFLTPKLYTDVKYGRNKYGWNLEGEYDNGTYAKVKAGVKFPSNDYSVEVEGGKKLEKYIGKFQMDKNENENNRYLFEGAFQNSGITNFEGLATFQIPGTLYSANLRHQGGDNYDSHVDVAWAPQKRVTADFTFTDDNRRFRRQTEGSLSFTTPFRPISEFKIAAGHTSNRRQYSSQLSVSMNKQPYALSFTTKKPLSLNDIDMQLSLTTPQTPATRPIGNPSITIRHVLGDEMTSSVTVTWGQGHIVSIDASGHGEYRRSRRNWVANIGINTDFEGYESFLLNITHEDDLRQYSSKIIFDHNGNQFIYLFSMNHQYSGWQIQNSGTLDITSPYDVLNIKWSHRNSDQDYRCSATADWANGERLTANLNGEIQITDLSTHMSHNLDIQIPSSKVRSITGKVEYDAREGFIKSEAFLHKNGRNLGTVKMNYNRLPGSVDFDLGMTSIQFEDFKTIIQSRHAASPFTAEASVQWAPMQKIELEGRYEFLLDHQVSDSRLTLRTPFQQAREIVYTVSKKYENLEHVQKQVLILGPRQQIVQETRLRWDNVKKYRHKITTPFPQFQDLDYGFYFSGDQNNFESNADFKVIPYVQKISTVASWQARRLQGSFRLNTPFPQYPYMMAEVSSGQLGQARTSKIVVEYLPTQKVEIDTSYSLTGRELDATLSFKSPFTGNVFSSYRHSHEDASLKSHAELIYRGNQKVILDLGYALEPTITGNIKMSSPIRGFETVDLAFNHDGRQWNDFHTTVSYATNGDKLELESMLDLVSGYRAKATLKSPFAVKLAQVVFTHEGSLMRFTTNSMIKYNDDKIEYNARFSHDDTVTSGLFTLENSFDVPIENADMSNMRALRVSFGKDGTRSDLLTLTGELASGEKKIMGTITHQMTDKGMTSTIIINNPFTETIRGEIDHNVHKKGFRTIVEGSAGRGYSLKSDTIFKLRKYDLDITQHFTGFLDGEGQDLLIKLAHEGEPTKFTNKIEGTFNRQTISSTVNVDVRSVENLQASVVVTTPFQGYAESSARANYMKSATGYSMEIVGLANGKEISFVKTQNGDSLENYQETTSLKTPFEGYRQMTSSTSSVLGNNGYAITHTSSSNGQDTNIIINFDVRDINNLHGSVTATLPIKDYETMSTSFRSNILTSGYSGQATAALKNKQFSVNVNLDGTTLQSLQGTASITTPIENYETLSATVKSDKQNGGYSMQITASIKDDQIFIDIEAEKLRLKNLQGRISIRTPFDGFETMSLYARSDARNNAYSGEVIAALKEKQFTIEATSDGTSNGRVSVTTPIENYEIMAASLTVNQQNSGFTSNAVASLQDQHITVDVTLDGKTIDNIQGSVVVKTPFDGFNSLSTAAKSIKNANGRNVEFSISYMDGKTISITSNFDLEAPNFSGDFHLRTPFDKLKAMDAEFSHKGTWSDFQSMATVSTGSGTPIKSELRVKLPKELQFEGIEISVLLPLSEFAENDITVNLKTDKKSGESLLDFSVEENSVKKISVEGAWKLNNRPKGSMLATGLRISTPHDAIRSFVVKLDHFNSASKTKEIVVLEHNGKTYLDMDARISHDDTISGSVNVRHPQEMEYTFTASKSGRKYSGDTTLNWDATHPDSRIRLEGSLTTGVRFEPFRDISLKVIHPSKTMSLQGGFKDGRTRFDSNMEFSLDRTTVGYDLSMDYANGKEVSLKVRAPSRSVRVTSLVNDGTTNAFEGRVFWDADRDDDKRVGVRVEMTPGDNSFDSLINLELPTIGKEFSLRRSTRDNDGNIWHTCRTEFSYSRDTSKTIVVNSRIEDLSSGTTSNYTYTVNIAHAHSAIDMTLTGHIADAPEMSSAGLGLNYLTSSRQTKNLLLLGQINKLRKELNLQVFAPAKSLSLTGVLHDDAPYSLHVLGTSGSSNVIDTKATINPRNKRMDFRTKYDTENPNSIMHLSVRYPSSMDIEAEMYRTGDFNQVTDTMLTVNLKSTRLLHTRIHWRPQMFEELLDFSSAVVRMSGEHASALLVEITDEIGKELEKKVDVIGDEMIAELKPIADALTEQLTGLQNQLNKLKLELRKMYKNNALYMQDINDVCNNAVSDFISQYGVAMRKFKKTYRDMRSKVEEVTNEIQNYPVKQKYEECITSAANKLRELKARIQTLVEEELEQAVEKMKQLTEELKIKINNLSNIIKEKINELMDEVTQHPDFQELKAELQGLLDNMPDIPELPDVNYREYLNNVHEKIKTALRNIKFAEHYEALANKGREFVNTHLGNIMAEQKIQKLRELTREFYEQALWSYRYLAIEEYAREIISDIYESTKQFIIEDIAQLRLLHWDKSRMIVFDPVQGEIEFELYLPTAVEALDRVPRLDYMKYFKKLQRLTRIKNILEKYLHHDFCLWDLYYKYKPTLNPRQWIPPFDSYAVISGGRHFVTFDKEHFDFIGRCSYVLTRDLIDNNFTVILNYNGNARNPKMESLLVMAEGQTIEMFPDFTIKANDRRNELPFVFGRLSVERIGNQIKLNSGRGLTITGDLIHEHFVIGISGWYFGKVAGLLGTYNNEQYDDMVLNNGQLTSDIEQFKTSWEVSRRCRADRNLATDIPVTESAQGYAECAALFKNNDSPVRPCYKQVDPESFMHMCMGHMLDNEGICKSTSLYVQSCRLQGVNLPLPQQCVQCSAPNDETFLGGETIKLSSSRDDYDIPQSADVVFIVEVKQCNQDAASKLGDLVYKIEQGLKSDAITANRYGLISFGSENLYGHTIEGQLFNDATKFTKGVESLQFAQHRETDPLNAILSAANFPFRSGVSKSIVLLQCGECSPSEKTNPIYLKHVLHARDITLHILRNQDFRLSGNQSPKQKILGMDNDQTYILGKSKDMSQYDDLVIPGDNCAALSLKSNGSIFDSAGFTLPKLQHKRQFLEVVSEKVSKTAIPHDCQICQCVADNTGAAMPICRKCYSSLSDYMPNWLSTLKHPAALQDAFQTQFQDYLGDNLAARVYSS